MKINILGRIVMVCILMLPLCTNAAEKKKRKRNSDSSEQNRPSKRAKSNTKNKKKRKRTNVSLSGQESSKKRAPLEEPSIVLAFDDDTKMQVSQADWSLIEKLGTIKDILEDLGKTEEIPIFKVSPDTFSKVLSLLKNKLNIENLSEQQLIDLIHAFNYLAGPESDFKKLCQAYVTYIEKNDIKIQNPFNPDIEHEIMSYMLNPVIPYLYSSIANDALAMAYFSVAGQTPKIYEMSKLENLQGIYAGNRDHRFSTIKSIRKSEKDGGSSLQLTIYRNSGEKIETLIDEFYIPNSYISPDGMLLAEYDQDTKKITIVDAIANKKYSVPCDACYFAAAFKCNEELRLFFITKVNQSYQFHILKFDAKDDSSAVVWKKAQKSIVEINGECQNIFFNNEGTIGAFYFGGKSKKTPAQIAFIDLQEQKLIKKIRLSSLIESKYYIPRVMVFEPFAASNIEVDIGGNVGNSYFCDFHCNIFPDEEARIKSSYAVCYKQHTDTENYQKITDQEDQAFFENIAEYITYMAKNWRTLLDKGEGGFGSCIMPRQLPSFMPWLTASASGMDLYGDWQRYKPQSFAVVNQEQGRLFVVNQRYNKIAEFSLYYPSVDELLGNITPEKVLLLYQAYRSIKNGKGELLIHPQTRNEELFDSMYSDENLRRHVLPVFFPAKTSMRMKSMQSQ